VIEPDYTPPATYCDCGVDHDDHASRGLECVFCSGCVTENERDDTPHGIDTTAGPVCGACMAGEAGGDAEYIECRVCGECSLLVRAGLPLVVCTDADCARGGKPLAPSLNEALAAARLTTKPAGHGVKSIHDSTGAEVKRGRAWEIWEWLNSPEWSEAKGKRT